MAYTITVHNRQGASDVATRESKADVNAYLASWSDPEELTAAVRDESGNDVASKPLGRKTLIWLGRPSTLNSGKRVNVYLDSDSLGRASKLGNGNVSEGIRIALTDQPA